MATPATDASPSPLRPASRPNRPSRRPRFLLRSPLAPAEIRKRVNARIQSSPRVRGIAFDHRIEIAIDGDDHHFWSPQLVVKVAPRDDGGADLDAQFGPDPYVWAMYLLSYGALSILTFFATMYGIAQLSLGQPPTAFYVAPAAAVLAGLVFGASFVGQGLAGDQMYFLRSAITELSDGSDPGEPLAERAPVVEGAEG